MNMRVFLAFNVSEEAKKELSKAVSVLSPKIKGVKWVDPNKMHCTVKFFGDIEEGLLSEVSNIIENETNELAKINLDCMGVGVFPNWRYPKVIWAGLAGETDKVTELHDRLNKKLERFNFQKDKRALRLHLTLGRAKSPIKNSKTFMNLIEKMTEKEFGKVEVNSLTLYKSVLTKEGSIYTHLREFPFHQGKK